MPSQITLSAQAAAFEADLEYYYGLGVALAAVPQSTAPVVSTGGGKDIEAEATIYRIGWLSARALLVDSVADGVRRAIQQGLYHGENDFPADSSLVVVGVPDEAVQWVRDAYAVGYAKGRRISGLPEMASKSGSIWKLLGVAVAIAGVFVIGNAIIGVGAKKNPIRKLGTVSFASERIVNPEQVRALLSEGDAVVFRSERGDIVKIHRSDDGFTVSSKHAGRRISNTYAKESVAADRFMDLVQGQQGEFYQLF